MRKGARYVRPYTLVDADTSFDTTKGQCTTMVVVHWPSFQERSHAPDTPIALATTT